MHRTFPVHCKFCVTTSNGCTGICGPKRTFCCLPTAGPVMGGDEELFRAEHRKIRVLLRHFVERIETVQRTPENLRRQVLSLLDEQAVYKSLLLHHELREHNLLFPYLDRVTQEAERVELLRQSHLP